MSAASYFSFSSQTSGGTEMNLALALEARRALAKTTLWQRFLMKHFGKKLYLGHEKREGWSGELPFYLFWCRAGKHFAKDYPHGFIERQYLACSSCGCRHNFVPWKIRLAILKEFVRFAIKYRPQRPKNIV